MRGKVDNMETIPSAIAAGSIVGAGALGLVFAQVDNTRTPRTSVIARRGLVCDAEVANSSPAFPRPATSAVDQNHSDLSTVPSPEQSTSDSRCPTSKRNTGRYSQIFGRRRKGSDVPAFVGDQAVDRKESTASSRGSWIKRLSTLEISQVSSPRSSIVPDSPSFSQASAAPILSTADSPVQLPPNKLVKRSTSKRTSNGSPISKTEKGYTHSLRRPATSHQRTATLQQQFRFNEASGSRDYTSLFSPISPTLPQSNPVEILQSTSGHRWSHFFVPRTTRQCKDRSPRDSSRIDGSFKSFYTTARRIMPDSMTPPTLITANMITSNQTGDKLVENYTCMHEPSGELVQSSNGNSPDQLNSGIGSPPKNPRRTLSKHFTTPPSWAFRTGSIGARKGQPVDNSDGDRNASELVTTSTHIPQQQLFAEEQASERLLILSRDDGDIKMVSSTLNRPARKRNTSSPPLPPLTRTSSFSLGLNHIGSSSSPSCTPLKDTAMQENKIIPMQYPVANQSPESGSSPPISATTHPRTHRGPEAARSDRPSTLMGSDTETRESCSGDDEDTDFQSETIFDSFRTGTTGTGTTGSLRLQHALETMFDASSGGGVSRNNLASLCDETLRGPNNISKEEKFVAVSNDTGRSQDENDFDGAVSPDMQLSPGLAYPSSLPALPLVSEDFGRLSLEEDDDDEDWAREAEEYGVKNSLSPRSSSANSRRVSVSLNLGVAVADLKRESPSAELSLATIRPYSSLFDWSESHTEHIEVSERPKTMHGMESLESTAVRRRAPNPVLLRTHSVPVVPDDVVGHSKNVGKTEKWEDDFFEHSDEGPDTWMATRIPPTIQASQANILGHMALMNNVIPIVNELKQLCNLAEEKDLLNGPHAGLWKEAEGIIALATPPQDVDLSSPEKAGHSLHEKNQEASTPCSPISIDFDHDAVDPRYLDCGFDGEDLDFQVEALIDKSARSMSDAPTVRRQSVFLPDDDIFGHSTDGSGEAPKLIRFLADPVDPKFSKPATFPRIYGKDTAAIARSVMETMHQYRSISDPLHSELAMKSPKSMPFDTTSLRDFVNRATVLVKVLGDILQASDSALQSPASIQSPASSPKRVESPAFTRVFNEPLSPPRRLPRTKSATSNLGESTNSSPTRNHGKRLHVMTVV